MLEQTNLFLKNKQIVVVDVETTGLNPVSGYDKICEIGAIKIINGRLKDKFHSMIDPCQPISPGAFMVNGITPEMLEGAPTFDEIASDFLRFIDGTIIAAYNCCFDINFINSELEGAGLGYKISFDSTLDILVLARRFLPGLPRYKLQSVAYSLRIKPMRAHRALYDAHTAWGVLKRIISVIERRSSPGNFVARD